ncbi:adrenodoxin, mitochondrial [Caerostris extrusa]|uniref:Adrenodoxin, mitochondrial n=1 Tax=Caerostris extrusa TaxID=172846 RepID=A0AAV4NLN6_CAEEX|nr:adrenodoxin, mitochondrial [Caerostris extrusa]
MRQILMKKQQWVTVIFEKPDGHRYVRKGVVGETIQTMIPPYDSDFIGYGQCQGIQMCTTCHVIFSSEDYEKFKNLSEYEEDALDKTIDCTKNVKYCNKSNQWVSVIFEKPDGTQIERNIEVGKRIYDAIQCNNPDFPGYGSCDGSAHCTTCHIILSKKTFYKYGEFSNSLIGEDEEDMIVCVTGHTATSRLGCCVKIVPEMDGMIVKLPEQVDSFIEKKMIENKLL